MILMKAGLVYLGWLYCGKTLVIQEILSLRRLRKMLLLPFAFYGLCIIS